MQYFDLFDPACPKPPPGVQLPIVMVNHEVLSNGVKIQSLCFGVKSRQFLKRGMVEGLESDV